MNEGDFVIFLSFCEKLLGSGSAGLGLMKLTMKIFLMILMLYLPLPEGFAESVVYVSLKSDDKVAIYSEDESSGQLSLIDTTHVPGGPASIAVTADQKHLYVARRNAKKISCYALDPETGALRFQNEIEAAGNPVYLSLDQTESCLFSVYFADSKFTVYNIEKNGSLNGIPVYEEETPKNPHAIQIDTNNTFLYITCMGGDCILQYQLEPLTGKPTALSPPRLMTPNGTGPRHFSFDPCSKDLFVVNEVASSVTHYRTLPSGNLCEQETLSTLPAGYFEKNKCADVHITPDGRFLYATNRGAETIAAFRISNDPERTLSLIGFFKTEATPREMGIDAEGKFLFAAGETSGRLQSYKINPTTGELSPLQNLVVGNGPAWIETVKLK